MAIIKQLLSNVVLAEPWTPKKQIASVGLLFAAIVPFALLYLFQSQVIKIIVGSIRLVASLFGVPMEEI